MATKRKAPVKAPAKQPAYGGALGKAALMRGKGKQKARTALS